MNNPIIRQGDVLLMPTTASAPPPNATPMPEDQRRIVLAYGEVTGHAHAIYDHRDPGDVVRTAIHKARLYSLLDGTRLLHVTEPVTLRHEEHTAHVLPPGLYEVAVQVDMNAEHMPQRVAD